MEPCAIFTAAFWRRTKLTAVLLYEYTALSDNTEGKPLTPPKSALIGHRHDAEDNADAAGILDHQSRVEHLLALGDPLPALSRTVGWKAFRPLFKDIHKASRENKGGRPPYDTPLAQINAAGYSARQGQIVDVAIAPTPWQRNKREKFVGYICWARV